MADGAEIEKEAEKNKEEKKGKGKMLLLCDVQVWVIISENLTLLAMDPSSIAGTLALASTNTLAMVIAGTGIGHTINNSDGGDLPVLFVRVADQMPASDSFQLFSPRLPS